MSEEDKTQERTPEEIAAAVAKAKAESRKAEAEAEQALAEARKANSEAVVLEIEQAKKEREEARELSKDKYHRIYNFHDSVSDSSVNDSITTIRQWIRECGDEPIQLTIDLDSPGGAVLAGFRYQGYLEELKAQGHTVTTHVSGLAASMAGIILMAGTERTAAKYSQLLIHRMSFGAVGSAYEVEDTVEWVRKMEDTVLDLFVDSSRDEDGKPGITKNQLKKKWDRKDWILNAEESLKYRFIDRITA